MEKIESLILRITERCNLNCAYCYATANQPAAGYQAVAGNQATGGPDMAEEDALKAVELCCGPGEKLRIQFTGGEPLLNRKVMEAVYSFGKATGRKLRLSVQTNGSLLTRETCRKLKEMNCAVGVSLDGVGKANGLRCFPDNSPSFQAAVTGIRNLGAEGIRCNLTVVVTKVNAPFLGKLPDLALWLGNVSGVGLDLFRELGRGAGAGLGASEEEFGRGLRELLKRSDQIREAGIPFRFREWERIKRLMEEKSRGETGTGAEIYCYAQTDRSLAMDGRGNFWPCSSMAGQPGCLLGNLADGLPTRWGKDCCPAPGGRCAACPELALCRGGCPAGRLAGGGEPDRLNCVMNRILTEHYLQNREEDKERGKNDSHSLFDRH